MVLDFLRAFVHEGTTGQKYGVFAFSLEFHMALASS